MLCCPVVWQMENWGCIFLDENSTNRSKSSRSGGGGASGGKGKAATGIPEALAGNGSGHLLLHEVAHMWLGDLVGLPFWAKEGLAQYMEVIIAAGLAGSSKQSCAPPSFRSLAGAHASEVGKKKNTTTSSSASASSSVPVAVAVSVDASPSLAVPCPSSDAESKVPSFAVSAVASLSSDFSRLFNGVTYSSSLEWVRKRALSMGPEHFRTFLTLLVRRYALRFVSEIEFVQLFDEKSDIY